MVQKSVKNCLAFGHRQTDSKRQMKSESAVLEDRCGMG